MTDRVLLEHRSRDPDHLILCGMVATEPVLVELDNAACMKLAGRCTTLNHQSIVEDHYGEIVEVVERLYDEHAFDAQGSHEVPHILVTALDLG